MLHRALEFEVEGYLERHRGAGDENGHALVTRNGKARPRKVTVGSGTMEVTAPRVRDERLDEDGERCRFTSEILPPYMRRSPEVAEALPVLYLRGLSTGDFREVLPALLGKEASAGLSPTTITRLTAEWQREYESFRKRDIRSKRFAYIWADGFHFRIRLEDDRLCTLALIDVREDGSKELIAVEDGYRESKENWLSVLRDLAARGVEAPLLAIGDGALGFWAALREVWPESKEQGCWVHRTANVLDNHAAHKTPAIQRWLARHPRFHLHFTPTGASWLNLVERWFAELTQKQLRRGVHRSPRELEKAIREFLEVSNEDPKPFVWTKSAEEILESVAALCKRTPNSRH